MITSVSIPIPLPMPILIALPIPVNGHRSQYQMVLILMALVLLYCYDWRWLVKTSGWLVRSGETVRATGRDRWKRWERPVDSGKNGDGDWWWPIAGTTVTVTVASLFFTLLHFTALVLHWYSICTPLYSTSTPLVLQWYSTCTPLYSTDTPLVLQWYSNRTPLYLDCTALCSKIFFEVDEVSPFPPWFKVNFQSPFGVYVRFPKPF